MFTGLVEAIGQIKSVANVTGGRRLTVSLGPLVQDAKRGDSICINGVCLTISHLRADHASFDVMRETLRVSSLERLKTGGRVNLERAMPADGRFGGHIVQGHVDGVGTVDEIEKDASKWIIWIACSPELIDLMIPKGSVAIEGVSLTLVEVQDKRFSVSLIPTTLAETTLQSLRVGDTVNLEADIINKWIKKRLDQLFPCAGAQPPGLTLEQLRQQGF